MKKKLYLVRHGQTLFNEKEKMQGWCDSPLTPLGHTQAKAVGDYLKKNAPEIDTAVCSSLGRAEQTLKDMTDLPYQRLDGLKEFCYGSLEGESTENALGRNGKKGTLEDYYVGFGGERKSEVQKRMMDTLKNVMDQEDAHTVLAVGHGSSSFQFASLVDPEKAKKLRKFANGLIYEFDYEDGKFHLVDITDKPVRHLQPERIKKLDASSEKKPAINKPSQLLS